MGRMRAPRGWRVANAGGRAIDGVWVRAGGPKGKALNETAAVPVKKWRRDALKSRSGVCMRMAGRGLSGEVTLCQARCEEVGRGVRDEVALRAPRLCNKVIFVCDVAALSWKQPDRCSILNFIAST